MEDHDLREPIDEIVKRYTGLLEHSDMLQEELHNCREELAEAKVAGARHDALAEAVEDFDRGLVTQEELVRASRPVYR